MAAYLPSRHAVDATEAPRRLATTKGQAVAQTDEPSSIFFTARNLAIPFGFLSLSHSRALSLSLCVCITPHPRRRRVNTSLPLIRCSTTRLRAAEGAAAWCAELGIAFVLFRLFVCFTQHPCHWQKTRSAVGGMAIRTYVLALLCRRCSQLRRRLCGGIRRGARARITTARVSGVSMPGARRHGGLDRAFW